MHEYLRDTLVYRYRECKSCTNRSGFTCIKCGFCWSCHWKMDQVDRDNKILPLVPLFGNHSKSVVAGEKKHRKQVLLESPTITSVIDVYGEEAEPICDYLKCHHKLSVHGLRTRGCRCKHPQNIAVGVS
jgi:hypothetical protein